MYTNIEHLFFSFWLTALCMTGSRFTRFTGAGSVSFLLMAEYYSTVCMYQNFFIHSSLDEMFLFFFWCNRSPSDYLSTHHLNVQRWHCGVSLPALSNSMCCAVDSFPRMRRTDSCGLLSWPHLPGTHQLTFATWPIEFGRATGTETKAEAP